MRLGKRKNTARTRNADVAEMQAPNIPAPQERGQNMLAARDMGRQAEVALRELGNEPKIRLFDDEPSERVQFRRYKRLKATPQEEDILIVPPMFTANPECYQTIIGNTPMTIKNFASCLSLEIQYRTIGFRKAKKKFDNLKIELLESGMLTYKQAAATLLTTITKSYNGCKMELDKVGYYKVSKSNPRTKGTMCRPQSGDKTSIRTDTGKTLVIEPKMAVWTIEGELPEAKTIDAKTYIRGLEGAFKEFSLGDPERYEFAHG